MQNTNLLAAMQVFIAVVDGGSFSEAARRLGVSQPSVSRQINGLEAHLGVRLLQRTTRRLGLTEAGRIYYDKAREVQRSVLDANQAVSGFYDRPSGLLRISAPHTWAEAKIAPHLGEFLHLYPDINLELQCDDRIQDMVGQQLDLVLRVGRATDSSYIAIPFADVQLVLCATPDYIRQHGDPKTLADLNNHLFITYRHFTTLICERDGSHTTLTLNSRVANDSVNAMISCAEQHLGLSVLPDLLVQDALHQGRLRRLLPEYGFSIHNLPVNQVFAMYPSRKKTAPKVRAFIDFFRDKFD